MKNVFIALSMLVTLHASGQPVDSMGRDFASQKAIIDSLRTVDPSAVKWAEFSRPVFLKAGERLQYMIFPMDHIKRPGETYKISYATEERDARTIEGANERAIRLPEHILGYTRYIPTNIVANTLYYSTVN